MKKVLKLINKKRAIILLVIASVFLLSVGYANSSADGTIENAVASIRPQAYARITDVELSSTSGGGLSNSEGYNMNNIFGSVTLPNANSEVTYKVDVTVFLSAIMVIKSISGLPNNLEYELTDYTLEDPLCDSNYECNYGAVAEFYLTIKYKENGYNASNTTYPFNLDFVFDNLDKTARIGNVYFNTLQEAVDAVLPDDNEVTVVLLRDTSEKITIDSHQNIKLNLQEFTLSNNGNLNVIVNEGTLKIYNGMITSDASTNGAINNNSTGTLVISGGSIIMEGARQALYNDGGDATITGTAYLKNTTADRSAVQNLSNGTLKIEGGTIISPATSAVKNVATLRIGVEDGNPDDTTPVMQGKTYGIESSVAYDFYNGIAKGKNKAVSDETAINNIETGYEIIKEDEVIDGETYHTLFIGTKALINFNGNQGTSTEASRQVAVGRKIGTLPDATRNGYVLDGWWTDPDDGVEINADTIVTAPTTYYAHWKREVIAYCNGTPYYTLQEAIDAVPTSGVKTTVTLARNTSPVSGACYNVTGGRNVDLDLGGHIISANGNKVFFVDYGSLELSNGTITSTANQGALNTDVNGTHTGTIIVNDITITITGGSSKQAIYNNGGTLYINAGANISNVASNRAAVHNLNNGTMYITGGTIKANNFYSVYNASGSLNIGVKDGSVSSSSPLIQGKTYGVVAYSTYNFYDGIIKGQTAPAGKASNNGTTPTVSVDTNETKINEIENNTSKQYGTETIGGTTYNTLYLS